MVAYRRSIKQQLSTIFCAGVFIAIVTCIAIISFYLVQKFTHWIDISTERIRFLQADQYEYSMQARGSMLQSDIQMYINELMVLAEAMSILLTGRIQSVGTSETRKWTYNITDYAVGGEAYTNNEWTVVTSPDGSEKVMFKNHSIFMNRFDETFDSMSTAKQNVYLRSQELDVIRIPPFNSANGAIEAYYQGFEEDGAYSYVGDEVTYYAGRAAEEIEKGRLVQTEVPEDCPLPIEELSYIYDPRCRPWYLAAKSTPDVVLISNYMSLDGTRTFCSLSKALLDDSDPTKVIGVSSLDLNLGSIAQVIMDLVGYNDVINMLLVNASDQVVVLSGTNE